MADPTAESLILAAARAAGAEAARTGRKRTPAGCRVFYRLCLATEDAGPQLHRLWLEGYDADVAAERGMAA